VVDETIDLRWRGAKIENIHQFQGDYPIPSDPRANYRPRVQTSTAAIALITQTAGRMAKILGTMREATIVRSMPGSMTEKAAL